jgi:tetratricopeptide (TPR) repeat protein
VWAVRNAQEAERQRQETDFQRREAEKNLEIANAAQRLTYDVVTDRAGQFWADERYEEAAALYQDIVRIRRETLGGAHPRSLNAVFNLASVQKSLIRYEEAIKLLEQALSDQEQSSTSDPDRISRTENLLIDLYWRQSLELTANSEITPEESRRAMQLAVFAQERRPDTLKTNLALALAEYRAGTASVDSECMAVVRTASRWFPDRSVACALYAMVSWQEGDEEIARCWHEAMCRNFIKASATLPIPNPDYEADLLRQVVPIVRECAELTGLPDPTSEPLPPVEDVISAYDMLIDEYPEVDWLQHDRGSLYGRIGDFDRAVADYEAAVRTTPEMFRNWESWLAVTLYLGDREACSEIFADAMSQVDCTATYQHADFLRLLWLCPEIEIDWNEIYVKTQQYMRDNPEANQYILRNAQAAYNCGEFKRVLELIELAVASSEATGRQYVDDVMIMLALRAMTLHQIGEVDEAKRSLEEAQAFFQEEMSLLDGEHLPFQDRPVVWCWLQVLLRKAEGVVDPVKTPDFTPSDGSA